MAKTVQDIRHILYRAKTNFLYKSSAGKFLMSFINWKTAGEKEGVHTLYKKTQDVFANYTLNHLSDAYLCKRFTDENTRWSKHDDIVVCVDTPVYIEPEYSLGIIKGRQFVSATKSKAHTHMQPSWAKYIPFKLFNRKCTEYNTLIHFDGYASKNLYHFFDDALNPLIMLMQSGLVEKNTPVLIHENIYSIKYVQYVLALPEFSQINWVIQKKGEWIRAKKVYKAITSKKWWNDLYEIMSHHVQKNPHRKVFLNRKPTFQRRLLNNDAIESYLVSKGFEVIYAEDLSYKEQVQLFSEVKYFIAAHGAGMTNLLYSDMKQLYVLELFSESLTNPHFYWFLEGAGIKYYDAILGSKLDINWNYSIDETLFKERVEAMLQGN